MTIQDAFRRFRKEFKLTQTELAETLGINPTSYNYEKSDREANPTAKTLLKLVNAYGVSVDYLLGLSDDPRPSSSKIDTKDVENLTLEDRLSRLEQQVAKLSTQ